MTNHEFGERIGVTESYASYVRNGKRLPSGEVMVRIIRAFELDPDTVMDAYMEGAESFGNMVRNSVFERSTGTRSAGSDAKTEAPSTA